MTISTITHLNFRGTARAALAFYHQAFGGELKIVTYQDAHNVQDPADADQVMWGAVMAPSGFQVMAYDVPAQQPWEPGTNAFFVSLHSTEAAEITACWEGLAPEATIMVPLAPAGWSALYGKLQDQFGIIWVLSVVTE